MPGSDALAMRAIEIAPGGGGPDALRPTERPRPAPAAGEVLIRVHAAGVNGHDTGHRRRGSHPIKPGESDLPGLEVAGEVAELGEGVTRWRIGDAVCALMRGGGYAEYAVADAHQCLPVPEGYSWIEAAALPETCFTVWSNAFTDWRLEPGQSLLMNGGSSGIGTTAIQIASALGVTVYATARGAEKCAVAERLGAARVFDSTAGDVAAAMREATDGKGVDMALDIVGGEGTGRILSMLAHGGVYLLIGNKGGSATAQIDFTEVVRNQLKLTGSMLRPRPPAYKARVAAELEARVWPLFGSRRIAPVIDSTFGLGDAAASHARMESGGHIGKIVLTVDW